MSIHGNDESLVAAALAGDGSAFGELARRYRGTAFGVAFHKLGDFEAARDAAQEALITAYLDLPTLREPARFGNWLYRITTMTALEYRRARRPTVSLDDPDRPELASLDLDPAESLDGEEKARRVREALSVLSEAERLATILHYVSGYSHEEIGGILGISVSAVKSRIHRARRRLREEMLDMVESSLKSEVPGIEFTRDLVDLALHKRPEYNEAVIENVAFARLQYTDGTKTAILKTASELAREGYTWLVAPPHIHGDDPAVGVLRSIGFRHSMVMNVYERPLDGDLSPVPEMEPGIIMRRLSETPMEQVLEYMRRVTYKHAPEIVDENSVPQDARFQGFVDEASCAACRGDQVLAMVTVYQVDAPNPKFDAGVAVLVLADYDPDAGSPQALESLISSAMRTMRRRGMSRIIKEQVMPNQMGDLVSVLQNLEFRQARTQLNLAMNLTEVSPEELMRGAERFAHGARRTAGWKTPRVLRFTASDVSTKHSDALRVTVREMLGTSAVVTPGEVYVVKGEYTLEPGLLPALTLACDGMSRGWEVFATPGPHEFTTTAYILEANPGKERVLDINADTESGTVTLVRLMIDGWGSRDS